MCKNQSALVPCEKFDADKCEINTTKAFVTVKPVYPLLRYEY